MRGAIQTVVLLGTIAIVVASFVNVFGDDAEQRKWAEDLACPKGCPGGTQMEISRTPFGETMHYAMPQASVTVHCSRAAILVGPWSCAKE